MFSWTVSQLKYSLEIENTLARILFDRKQTWMLGNALITAQAAKNEVTGSPDMANNVTLYQLGVLY